MNFSSRAIFFDRDGVLNEDVNLLCNVDDVVVPRDTIEAFRLLSGVECRKVVVTNQTVICRGLATESQVDEINAFIGKRIFELTSCRIDAFYVCPHHPEATLEEYRIKCDCRKPKAGLLLKAATDIDIDLTESWMIGDRISDVVAGFRAGCRTVLVRTGKHIDKPIMSDSMDLSATPTFSCDTVVEAVEHIIKTWAHK